MVACVLIPRFALRVASGDRLDEPLALAPPPGARAIGEVSGPAEAAGVHPGMALGEALARCPTLRLLAPDPARAAGLWDELLCRLEGIGAAVESERPGEAFFAVDGMVRLHGGEPEGVLVAAREAAAPLPARLAAAPNRFASLLAARRGSRLPRGLSRSRGEAIVPARALGRFLAAEPVGALAGRLGAGEAEEAELIASLRRLGLGTLGKLAALAADQVADRFGPIGARALRLARGEDAPPRPRAPREELGAEIELPDGTAGPQLENALGLLVDRLLADPRRGGRALLALRLTARLEGGGSWSAEQVLGRPGASAPTIRSLLGPRLESLPAPASALGLRAVALTGPAADQLRLTSEPGGDWRGRLAAAAREVRALAGAEALLRVVEVEPRSRLPERRMLLAPYSEER